MAIKTGKKELELVVDLGRITAMTDILMVIACKYPEDSEIYQFVKKEVEHLRDFMKEYLERCKGNED